MFTLREEIRNAKHRLVGLEYKVLDADMLHIMVRARRTMADTVILVGDCLIADYALYYVTHSNTYTFGRPDAKHPQTNAISINGVE